MNLAAISHRCAWTDCYALDENRLEINIKTGYDVDSVVLVWSDSAVFRKVEPGPWSGGRVSMQKRFSLKNHIIWNCSVEPPYKRTIYYFEITGRSESRNKETVLLFENDFATPEQFNVSASSYNHFKMAWMNSSDIVRVPGWVKDTIWYQIMPDRFCSAGNHYKRLRNRSWDNDFNLNWSDFFGGDLAGVISRLDYLKDLGISGIYFTPVFKSSSNHKYNTEDYGMIDPDFGTDLDMKKLVEEAHRRGIRIMLDAVFNHSGNDFPYWLDVVENGEKSAYKDWFFVNQFPLDKNDNRDTSDGRYFSFDFVKSMPKLNTNNPQVQDYLTKLCQCWVNEWNIDAIRFDVANEISHDFVKHLRRELCRDNPDLFLLGEIWTDSIQWLSGDEYHSVMNYPFKSAMEKAFSGLGEFSKEMENVYSLYYRPVNNALFNFIDTHDTGRAINSCKNIDEFYQKLVVLMTMQGSPCIFYGTEVALEGAEGPENRRPMPWKSIENGDYSDILDCVKKIISIRKLSAAARAEKIEFIPTDMPGHIHYVRRTDDGSETLRVCLNISSEPMKVVSGKDEKILFGKKSVEAAENIEENGSETVYELLNGGILVLT